MYHIPVNMYDSSEGSDWDWCRTLQLLLVFRSSSGSTMRPLASTRLGFATAVWWPDEAPNCVMVGVDTYAATEGCADVPPPPSPPPPPLTSPPPPASSDKCNPFAFCKTKQNTTQFSMDPQITMRTSAHYNEYVLTIRRGDVPCKAAPGVPNSCNRPLYAVMLAVQEQCRDYVTAINVNGVVSGLTRCVPPGNVSCECMAAAHHEPQQ